MAKLLIFFIVEKNLKTRAQSESLKRTKDSESAAKKPRVTTPSPLPTFKVHDHISRFVSNLLS